MQVTVRPYLIFQKIFGQKSFTVSLDEGATVRDLLLLLHRKHGLPEEVSLGGRTVLPFFTGGEPTAAFHVLVGGQSARRLQGFATPLADGAVVDLFPPAAGG